MQHCQTYIALCTQVTHSSLHLACSLHSHPNHHHHPHHTLTTHPAVHPHSPRTSASWCPVISPSRCTHPIFVPTIWGRNMLRRVTTPKPAQSTHQRPVCPFITAALISHSLGRGISLAVSCQSGGVMADTFLTCVSPYQTSTTVALDQDQLWGRGRGLHATQ